MLSVVYRRGGATCASYPALLLFPFKVFPEFCEASASLGLFLSGDVVSSLAPERDQHRVCRKRESISFQCIRIQDLSAVLSFFSRASCTLQWKISCRVAYIRIQKRTILESAGEVHRAATSLIQSCGGISGREDHVASGLSNMIDIVRDDGTEIRNLDP